MSYQRLRHKFKGDFTWLLLSPARALGRERAVDETRFFQFAHDAVIDHVLDFDVGDFRDCAV